MSTLAEEVGREREIDAARKVQHSYNMACWAFGTGVFLQPRGVFL